MSQDRSIKFQFVVDEASVQKVRASLRDILADVSRVVETMQKAGGALGGLGGGSGQGFVTVGGAGGLSPQAQKAVASTPPAAQGLVNTFAQHSQIFKGMAEGSKDSLRLMTEGLRQAVTAQRREVQDLDRAAAHLVETYDELGRKLKDLQAGGRGDTLEAKGVQDRQVQALDDHAQIVAERRRVQTQIQTMGGGGGGGTPDDPAPAGPGWFGARSMSGGMRSGLRMAGLGLGGLKTISDEVNAENRGETSVAARRGNMMSGHIRAMAGGDVSLLMGMRLMDAEQRMAQTKQTGGHFGSEVGGAFSGVGSAMGSLPIVGSVAKALGIAGETQPGGLMGGFSTANRQGAMTQNALQMAQERMQHGDAIMLKMAMENFSGGLGQRVQAGRVLGLGVNDDPTTGGMRDSYGRLQNKLSSSGYGVEEYMGAFQGLRGQAGSRFAHQNAGLAMRAAGEGLGGFSELLGASGRAGGGSGFALGALGGGIDRSAGIGLGNAIIGNGFDVRGTTNGLGTLAAAQGGGFNFTGGAGDFRETQRLGAGMGLLNGIVGGGIDSFQGGRNLTNAIGSNPNMSVYGQDYLANGMNMRQMIDMGSGKSPLTATARALGLSQEGIRGQLGSSVSSFTDRFVDTGKDDPMSQVMREYRGSGKEMPEFLQGLKGKNGKVTGANREKLESLGAFFGLQSGQGEEAGIGAVSLLAGIDSSKVSKGRVGGGIGGLEKTALESMAKQAEKVTMTLEIMGKALRESYKDAPKAAAMAENFARNLGSESAEFVKALQDLTMAVKGATSEIRGDKKPAKPQDPGRGAGATGVRGGVHALGP